MYRFEVLGLRKWFDWKLRLYGDYDLSDLLRELLMPSLSLSLLDSSTMRKLAC